MSMAGLLGDVKLKVTSHSCSSVTCSLQPEVGSLMLEFVWQVDPNHLVSNAPNGLNLRATR